MKRLIGGAALAKPEPGGGVQAKAEMAREANARSDLVSILIRAERKMSYSAIKAMS